MRLPMRLLCFVGCPFLLLQLVLGQQEQLRLPSDVVVSVVSFSMQQQECVIVHSTGVYRREQVALPGANKPEISEASLDPQDLQLVRAIIDQPEFKELKAPSAEKLLFRGKVYLISVPRKEGLQRYRTEDVELRTPPKAVRALLDWIKQMNRRTRPERQGTAQCPPISVQ